MTIYDNYPLSLYLSLYTLSLSPLCSSARERNQENHSLLPHLLLSEIREENQRTPSSLPRLSFFHPILLRSNHKVDDESRQDLGDDSDMHRRRRQKWSFEENQPRAEMGSRSAFLVGTATMVRRDDLNYIKSTREMAIQGERGESPDDGCPACDGSRKRK